VLDGLIIERGNADGPMNQYDRGGGMYNWLGGPTLRNCTFRLNASTYGGAVYNDASDATFHNCTFEDNQAVIGGGVLLYTYNSTTTIGAVPFRAQSGHQRRRRRACMASIPRSISDQCNLDRERGSERRRILRCKRHARGGLRAAFSCRIPARRSRLNLAGQLRLRQLRRSNPIPAEIQLPCN
jgi:hypothetical protein